MARIFARFTVLAAAILTSGTSKTATVPPLGFSQTLEQSWAGYSPWFPVHSYVPPPSGCEVVQVNLLQRHGARYPTTSLGEEIQTSLQKLQEAKEFTNPRFNFIKTYKDTLGVELLVPYGAAESFVAGYDHYKRYASLVNEAMIPFVRSTGIERCIESAWNWTAGFANASSHRCNPVLDLIISETSNDTLNTNLCPAAVYSTTQTDAWMNVFTPKIVDRFNAAAPGVNLTGSDILNLMSICPFDTVANEAPSEWCRLFSSDEWTSYEYYSDLGYYYGSGYGNTLGPVQGVGWVNELLARLTGQPVQDETQTNHTLDDNPSTFPLNRTFYADFTHDDDIIAVLTAIGLYKTENLDPTRPDPHRNWVTSKVVPFAGRMITEKIACKGKSEEYVRILVNDAVQQLDICEGDKEGMCTLSSFVESQKYSRENGEGDFLLCFEAS